MDAAREAGNLTALAAFSRLRIQVLGMIQNSVTVNVEQTWSDEELCRRLAQGDPEQEAKLRKMLGKSDTYVQ
jgi:hypothetical protein